MTPLTDIFDNPQVTDASEIMPLRLRDKIWRSIEGSLRETVEAPIWLINNQIREVPLR